MSQSNDQLVTIVIFAYNQEGLIEEAIKSAFAQTYQPLEILLSDDCSPDETFDVMQRMAETYDGPHAIKLNRNEQNMGAIGHVNKLFELSSGCFIVVNSGDDLSTPDRVEKLFKAYNEAGRPLLVHSDVTDMDATGKILKRQKERINRHQEVSQFGLARVATATNLCIGAACGWNPEIMSRFGPISELGAYGDRVFYFRARLAGEVGFVPERLIYYRRGQGIQSRDNNAPDHQKRKLRVDIACFRQRLKDCLTVSPNKSGVVSALERKIKNIDAKLTELEVDV